MVIDKRFNSVDATARRCGVPTAFLRAEAKAGRLPHLKVGRRVLFDIEAVLKALSERAADAGKAVSHV